LLEQRKQDLPNNEIKPDERPGGNLCNIMSVLISLCDSDAQNQIESMSKYSGLENKLDSMEILVLIKKIHIYWW